MPDVKRSGPTPEEIAWNGHKTCTPNTPVYKYYCGKMIYLRLSPKGAEVGRISLAAELNVPVGAVEILNGGHII